MNKIILIFFIYIFQLSNLSSNEIKLEEVIKGLKSPWSLSFVTDVDILVTEKSGNIFKINLINKRKDKFSHNLNVLEDRQGGLLEILYKNKEIEFIVINIALPIIKDKRVFIGVKNDVDIQILQRSINIHPYTFNLSYY